MTETAAEAQPTSSILTCDDLAPGVLTERLGRYGLRVVDVAARQEIPGSYWGAPEAGLRGERLYVRGDTPVHSALHEACHWVCMDRERRAVLDTDAGGEDLEECGVCYLQIRLADFLPGVGSERLCRDMDAWGYSFRLGSTRAWFEEDAEDARLWLLQENLLDPAGNPIWRPRLAPAG